MERGLSNQEYVVFVNDVSGLQSNYPYSLYLAWKECFTF